MAAPVGRHPHSPSTRRAYDSDWSRFVGWCNDHGHRPLPAAPSVVATYLRDAAQARNPAGEPPYAAATLRRWAVAIANRHRMSDHPSPTTNDAVRQALSAITKTSTTTVGSSRPATPLLTADIAAMIGAARKGTIGWATEVLERRDSAVLLVGYAGALGRGDLVGMLCGDVTRRPDAGLQVAVRRPNSDGTVALTPAESHCTCPPCAAQRWMQVVAAFDSGGRAALIRMIKADEPFEEHICRTPLPRTRARSPLFRSIRKNGNLSPTPLSGASIHLAVRRRARLAGYDDEFVTGLGAQSLRAGFIAQALRNNADVPSILRQTGHLSREALQRYAPADPGVHNAVTGLGL